MKKHIIRIVVAVLVVAALAYLVYVLAFKPSPDIYTFNELTSLNSQVEKLEITKKMNKLKVDASNEELRYVIQNDTSATLFQKYSYLNEIYDYYYAYTGFASNVKSSVQKAIRSKANTYKSSLSTLASSVDEAYSYYDKTKSSRTAAQQNELNNYYRIVRNNLWDANDNLVLLINDIKSFVQNYVFGGSYIYDTKSCHIDMLRLSIQAALNNGDAYANCADYDVTIARVYTSYKSTSSSSNHAKILNSYVTLSVSTVANSAGPTYLDKIFALRTADQHSIASGVRNDSIFGVGDDTLFEAAENLFTRLNI